MIPRALTWQKRKATFDLGGTLLRYQSDPALSPMGRGNGMTKGTGTPALYVNGQDMQDIPSAHSQPIDDPQYPAEAGSVGSHHSQNADGGTEYSYNDGRSHPPPSTNNPSIGGPPTITTPGPGPRRSIPPPRTTITTISPGTTPPRTPTLHTTPMHPPPPKPQARPPQRTAPSLFLSTRIPRTQ